ncbi:MAG: ATP-binding protein [Thermodesulfobacteriota bacterium]
MIRKAVFKEDFDEFIDDTGIQIKHSGGRSPSLRDIYIFPDVDVLSPGNLAGAGPGSRRINSSALIDAAEEGGGVLVCGPEDSGKTSLLKVLARRFAESGFFPLYADGKSLRIPRPEETAEFFLGKYGSQYTAESCGLIRAEPRERRILLLDNADRIRTGSAELGSFLLGLKEHFGGAVLTAVNPPEFTGLPSGLSVYGVPAGYAVCGIAELGHALREELISKWTGTGRAEDDKTAAQRKDRLRGAVDAVLARNLVPSYPVFILTILQMADSEDQEGPGASSYGQYYDYLITKSLKDAVRREDLPFFMSLLSGLAYRMFSRRSRWISGEDLEALIGEVSADSPHPPEPPASVIAALLGSETLAGRESGYEFRYGYIYHYFAALYFSRSLHDENLKEEVKRLAGSLDDEEYANIMLFLIHLSGDPFLLEQIARNVEYAAVSEEHYGNEEEETYLDDLLRELDRLMDKDRKLKEIRAEYLTPSQAEKQPIGFRTNGADIRVRRRKEAALYGSARKSQFVDALLRVSSELLYGEPATGPRDVPREIGENVYALWLSSLKRRKREADRMREAAEGMEEHVIEVGGPGEEISYLTALYGLYMRIYLLSVRRLSLLTEAGSPEYEDTIPDELMRICSGLFRKDQPPDIDTIGRFLDANKERRFARELVRECASLRIYIFGDDSDYSRELKKLLGIVDVK